MNTQYRKCAYRNGLLALLVCGVAFGCAGGGSGTSESEATGSITQGAVTEALVYADHLSGPEANYSVDESEVDTVAMIDDNGTFTLARTPDYDYVVVSQFGQYTFTGRPAMQMVAPAGARNISPLTTLVALNQNTRAVIESLGVAYDTDVSTAISPAALLLLHSAEMIVAAVTEGLNHGGDILLPSDINVIQRTLMTEIADKIQNQTGPQLTDTMALTATLEAAVKNALVSIGSNTSIAAISIDAPAAASIVGPIVKTVAQAIGAPTKTTAFSTTLSTAQKAIIKPDAVETITAGIDNAADAIFAVAKVTTKKNNPPPIISGTPPTTVTVGEDYYFRPTVTDTDNNRDVYIFCITKKPKWAKFKVRTGELTGTPKAKNVGTTTGIIITVVDVFDSFQLASLPAFDITVMASTGSVGGSGF